VRSTTQQYLQNREDRSQGAALPEEQRKARRQKKKGNKPQFDLRAELFRLTGTDLTRIDSIDVMTATTIISEAGYDMSKWGTRTICFLAAAVSGQSHQRGEDHRERSAADQQQGDGRLKDGGQHLAVKRYLSRSAVSSTCEPS